MRKTKKQQTTSRYFRRHSNRNSHRRSRSRSHSHMRRPKYKRNMKHTMKHNLNPYHKKMYGGNADIQQAYGEGSYSENVPFLPPGRPYVAGEINGLGNGYYYPLSSDLHAPNDAIINTSLRGNIGPSLTAPSYNASGGGSSGVYPSKKETRGIKGTKIQKRTKNTSSRRNRKTRKHASIKKSKAHKGGALLPSDIVNLGRNVVSSVQSAYAGYVGKSVPPQNNPNPTYQPALEQPSKLNIQPPNIPEMSRIGDEIASRIE